MNLAPNWEVAAAGAAVLAIVALAARAVSWSGAVAGLAVGVAVAAGFGWPGLIVLGTFFVVGSVATRVGYAKKAARGAAEKRGGARDWRNVVGKGGVAAAVAVMYAFRADPMNDRAYVVFTAAVAAALADTLGTEIGTLSTASPRALPWFRPVPTGTAGAVSLLGLAAAASGAAAVVGAAFLLGLGEMRDGDVSVNVGVVAFLATIAESLTVSWLPVRGFVRNLLTTTVAAVLALVGTHRYY